MTDELETTQGAINRWLQCYNAARLEELETSKAPGRQPQLTAQQREELNRIIEAAPIASAYGIGLWTGPMGGSLIAAKGYPTTIITFRFFFIA